MATDEELFNLEKEKNVVSPLGSVKRRVLKLMQLARADAVEGRDVELLKEINQLKEGFIIEEKKDFVKKAKLNGFEIADLASARIDGYYWAVNDFRKLLSPKPEEKKKEQDCGELGDIG